MYFRELGLIREMQCWILQQISSVNCEELARSVHLSAVESKGTCVHTGSTYMDSCWHLFPTCLITALLQQKEQAGQRQEDFLQKPETSMQYKIYFLRSSPSFILFTQQSYYANYIVICRPWGRSTLIASTLGCRLGANMWLLLFQNDLISMTFFFPSEGVLSACTAW